MNVYECSSISSNKGLSEMYLFAIDAKLHSATVLVSLRRAIMEKECVSRVMFRSGKSVK